MDRQIKTGKIYHIQQISGYNYIKRLDSNYHFVYRQNNKIYDVYASGEDKFLMITSIWEKGDRIKKDSITIEDKL